MPATALFSPSATFFAARRPQGHTQDSVNHATRALLWDLGWQWTFVSQHGKETLLWLLDTHPPGHIYTLPKCPEGIKDSLLFLEEVFEVLEGLHSVYLFMETGSCIAQASLEFIM